MALSPQDLEKQRQIVENIDEDIIRKDVQRVEKLIDAWLWKNPNGGEYTFGWFQRKPISDESFKRIAELYRNKGWEFLFWGKFLEYNAGFSMRPKKKEKESF